MAKGKSRSTKSKSAGSHRKKHGARSNLAVDAFLGQLTFSPHYTLEASLEDPGDNDLRFKTAYLGLPRSATVSDPGFFGRPKSGHKTWVLNPVFTGGMAFPEFLAMPVVRDGRVMWESIPHDEHRDPVKVRDLPDHLRQHFMRLKCAMCGKIRKHDSQDDCCDHMSLQPDIRSPEKELKTGAAGEARRQRRETRKLSKDRIKRRVRNRACRLIRDGSITLSDSEREDFTQAEFCAHHGKGCGCQGIPDRALAIAAVQIGNLLRPLPQ